MVVLSYHSGEDRIVKAALAEATNPPVPHGLPVIPDHLRPTARVLTRGSQKASEDEVLRNPRAASVRLRAVEKVAGNTREV
jgi:16S rRNA (cytosine1402-N4)-methyltransferase